MTHLVCDDLTSIVQSFVNQLASSAIARSHYAMVDFGRGNKVIGGHQFQGEIKPTSSAGSAKDLIDITPMHQKSLTVTNCLLGASNWSSAIFPPKQ